MICPLRTISARRMRTGVGRGTLKWRTGSGTRDRRTCGRSRHRRKHRPGPAPDAWGSVIGHRRSVDGGLRRIGGCLGRGELERRDQRTAPGPPRSAVWRPLLRTRGRRPNVSRVNEGGHAAARDVARARRVLDQPCRGSRGSHPRSAALIVAGEILRQFALWGRDSAHDNWWAKRSQDADLRVLISLREKMPSEEETMPALLIARQRERASLAS